MLAFRVVTYLMKLENFIEIASKFLFINYFHLKLTTKVLSFIDFIDIIFIIVVVVVAVLLLF